MAAAVRFELTPALASWSEAGVALKPTDLVPSWSAITGMVGAAFGWPRGDARLTQFASDYAMALRILRFGELFEDFHTVESPEAWQVARLRPRTRVDELSVRTHHFTITRREYLSGAAYDLMLIPLVDSRQRICSPQLVVDALASPVFPIYAGRRSCPLGVLRARLSSTEEVVDFLETATHWDDRLKIQKATSFVRERRDMLVGFRQFAIRLECVA